MSNKNEPVVSDPIADTSTEQQQDIVAEEQSNAPTIYDDLLKNGTAILEAPTREALVELVDNIPADCRYSVGAVGRKQDGSAYTIRVDLI